MSGVGLNSETRHATARVCIERNLYLINYNSMRTKWTTKGNSAQLCQQGGGGGWPPQPPPSVRHCVVSSSRVACPLKKRPLCCLETSGTNRQLTRRHIQEERTALVQLRLNIHCEIKCSTSVELNTPTMQVLLKSDSAVQSVDVDSNQQSAKEGGYTLTHTFSGSSEPLLRDRALWSSG
jgi:hypothetical protein